MLPSSRAGSPLLQRLLAVGLLLAAAFLGAVEPHAEHGIASSLEESLSGDVFQPSACHPHQPAHLEAAGSESHSHPCAACLHLYRSLALIRPVLPAPPRDGREQVFPPHAGAPSAGPSSVFADPRAPPASLA